MSSSHTESASEPVSMQKTLDELISFCREQCTEQIAKSVRYGGYETAFVFAQIAERLLELQNINSFQEQRLAKKREKQRARYQEQREADSLSDEDVSK